MKPLLLELHAFGPFATSERVDFTALGEHRFFLIHGPTGAGKTSLLDAICYALFGDTSGGERGPSSLRSDHAHPSAVTRVVFELALGARRFRIDRSPEQPRPKKRGPGTSIAKAEAQLDEWVAGAWQSLETQPQKVKLRCEALLGFSSEQFRQVVVLPQGRFREVLTAKHEDRAIILKQLFSTELYLRIEKALKLDAGSIEGETRELGAEKRALYALADVPDDAALDVRRTNVAADLAHADTQVVSSRAEEVAARAALKAAEDAATKLAELAEATRLQGLADAEAPRMEPRRVAVAEGKRAQRVHPVESSHRRAQADLEAARGRALASQSFAETARLRASAAIDVLAAEAECATLRVEAEQRAARLAELCEKVQGAAVVRDKLGALSAQLDVEVRAHLAEAQARRLRLVEESRQTLETTRAVAARLDALVLRQTSAREREQRTNELSFARVELAQTEASVAHLRSLAEAAAAKSGAAADHVAALALAHRAGQAARLSATLHDGEACPVCGSDAHPRPAAIDVDLVTDELLERAQTDVRRAEAEAARAARAHQTLREKAAAERAGVEQRIAELGVGEQQALDVAALDADVVIAKAAERRALALGTTLAAQLREVEQAGTVLAAFDERRATLEQERARLEGELRALLSAVPEDQRDLEALRATRAAAQATLAQLAQAFEVAREASASATRDLAVADARHVVEADARDRLEEPARALAVQLADVLTAAGFADEASYRAAWLEPEAMGALERAVAEHDHRRAAAHDRAARAAQAAEGVVALDATALDLPAAGARVAAAATTVERALTDRQDARSRLGTITRVTDGLASLSARTRDAEARYALVGRLADVASGSNASNLQFHSFVLGYLLDEVLQAASVRLQTMSRGRFELLRATRVEDRRRSSGLDIDVLDHHTGTRRPGNTLSGGEGFLAALALALGLADVVQARAGGIRLETLFVDEGFGSLDPASLESALDTLFDLQHSGRLVGIISHVAELTERIDVRLEVKSTGHGSRIELHLP